MTDEGRESGESAAIADSGSTESSVWSDLPPGTAPPDHARVFVIEEDASAVGDRITYDQAIAFADVPLTLLPEQQPRPRALVVSADYLDHVQAPSKGPLGRDGNHHYNALLLTLWTGHELLILDSNTRDLAEAMKLVDVVPPFAPYQRKLPVPEEGAGPMLAGEILQFLPGRLEGWQIRSVGSPIGFGVQEVPGLAVGYSHRPAYGALNASLWNGLSQ